MQPFKIMCLCFIVIGLIAFRCEDDDGPIAPIDKLPEPTMSGERTFGCLINGEAYLPKGNPLAGPKLSCWYQYLPGKGYFFGLSAFRNGVNGSSELIHIKADSMIINGPGTFIINGHSTHDKLVTFNGYYSLRDHFVEQIYNTYDNCGEIQFTRFDVEDQVASGTFWFNAVNRDDRYDTLKIREGRFDVKLDL